MIIPSLAATVKAVQRKSSDKTWIDKMISAHTHTHAHAHTHAHIHTHTFILSSQEGQGIDGNFR